MFWLRRFLQQPRGSGEHGPAFPSVIPVVEHGVQAIYSHPVDLCNTALIGKAERGHPCEACGHFTTQGDRELTAKPVKIFLLFQIDWVFFFRDEENGTAKEVMSYSSKFQSYPISSIYLVTLFKETPLKIKVFPFQQAVNAEDAGWGSQVPRRGPTTCGLSHKLTWTSAPRGASVAPCVHNKSQEVHQKPTPRS